jgi:tyrosyl-tRNA synthetase
MGKTARGATWLDADRLSPYDYFQYFRNVHDDDVVRLLKLYTFLDLEEIDGLEREVERDVNAVKERLALEATTLAHGAPAAQHALEGARAAFGGGGNAANVPTLETALPRPVVDLLVESALCNSKSDARRQIQGGAVRVDEHRVTDISAVLEPVACDSDGACMLWRGKKRSVRVVHTS